MGELPDNWTKLFEETVYNSHVQRRYTRISYVSKDGTTLRISDVQEPNSFGGWGYLVRTDKTGSKPLGLVESLDEAKTLALEYMRERAATPA